MSVQLVLKNSSVQDKEATAAQLAVGELALNYHSSGPFLQCEDSAGNIWRLGGVTIASTAPSSPSKGAWWLDSDDDSLHFYDGSSWVEISTQEIAPGKIAEGTARQLLQTNAAGTDTEWTSNIDVPGTLDVTGVATFDNNVVISGNLTVDGTTTTIDSTTLVVEDKNVELGAVDTPTDTTANGGGITLKGATDKTLTWVSSTGAWTFNQPLDVNGEVECDGIANGTSSVSVANNGNVTITRAGTTSIDVDGNGVQLPDNIKLRLGSSSDLQIYHDNADSYITDIGTGSLNIKAEPSVVLKSQNVNINNAANTEHMARFYENGAVELYHDNSKKLETTSTGIDVTGEVQGDSLDIDGAADISGNVTLHGNLDLQDNDVLHLGDSNDLQIYHNGSGSYIDDTGTGDLRIRANNLSLQKYTGENYFVGTADGAAYLYYDAAEKLATTSSGIDVTGTVQANRIDAVNTGGPMLVLKDSDSSGTSATMWLEGHDSLGNQKWYVGDTNANGDLRIRNQQASSSLILGTSAGDRVIIDPSGNLNPDSTNSYDLGTSSKQWRNAYFDGTVNCDGLSCNGAATVESGVGQLIIKDNNNTGTNAASELLFQQSDGANLGYIGYVSSSDSVYSMLNRQNAEIRFGTNNTWRCLITAGGHFKPYTDSVSDFGDTNNRWKTLFVDNVDFSGFVKGVERTATASSFDMSTGNFWTFGAIAVPNPTNQSAGMMGSLRVTAAPTSFASNWKFPGGSYTAPTSFPAVAPFFVQASGTILVGSWTEGIA